MTLTGIHHLTAITANARANKEFYTDTLGLRLVKKTVNQDDTSAYHLFYADGVGSPGTDRPRRRLRDQPAPLCDEGGDGSGGGQWKSTGSPAAAARRRPVSNCWKVSSAATASR